MALDASGFADGDGIVKADVEETIDVVRKIASEGMRETDVTVIRHMMK